MSSNKPKKQRGKLNPELKNFQISINKFGQLERTMSIDSLNAFLNKHVQDKKLKDREETSPSEDL